MMNYSVQVSRASSAPNGLGAENTLSCLVCGGTYRRSRLPGLFQCDTCGFVSADLSIPDDQLRALYGADYFHGHEYLDYVAEEESLRLNFRNRIETLREFISNWSQADVFEIGCAYGFFLSEIENEVGWASGIDISAEAVRFAREELGVDAQQGDYLALPLGRKVDAIVMWDTIEHLKRPDLFIAKAASDLKVGGVIALTTGDIGSVNARLRGRRWRMIHPPTHMHYFSVATISRLLERHGFDVMYVGHPGNSRGLRFILYFILVLQMKRPKIYAKLKSWRVFDLRLTLNLFDIMYIIARRRPGEGDR